MAMPGQHPDDDLLADLAADVLPVDQARTVEAHVLSCDRCASLLSDAEHVRGLLLADDAGPVPPEIWTRIEAALQAASSAPRVPHASRAEDAAPPPPPLAAAPAGRPADAGQPGGWDGPDPLDDPDDWATAVRPAASSQSRPQPGARTGGARRFSTSRRDTRPERRLRPAPLLLGAAAAVVLLLAVGAVRIVQSGGGPTAAFDSSGSSAGAASSSPPAAAGGVAAAVITRSNKDYTSSTLADGAKSLVRRFTANKAEGTSTRVAPSAPEPRAAASPGSVAPDSKATDVTNPQRLAACLTALGASSDALVAVDLARYQGREAAVLVVRTASGYEVWVVERTCHPGDEGALAERTLAG
jgi:hypothetical protein